jgi:catechol 2,3-dioxygenase
LPDISEARVRFAPERLTHVNLFVSDLSRSLDFYQDVCGLQMVFDEPGIAAVFLSNGNSHHDVALMQASNVQREGRDGHVQVAASRGSTPGLNHLGFEVSTEAQLVQAIGRAQSAGFDLHRLVDHQISHSTYFFDPDRVYLELYADAARDWRRVYRQCEGELLSGDWNPHAGQPNWVSLTDPSPTITRVESAAMHPIRTARAQLKVSDLEVSTTFYKNIVGMTVIDVPEPLANCGVALAGNLGHPDLTLIQATDSDRIGLDAVSFEVESAEDIPIGADRLRMLGANILAEAETDSVRSITVTDPDGLKVEFFGSLV